MRPRYLAFLFSIVLAACTSKGSGGEDGDMTMAPPMTTPLPGCNPGQRFTCACTGRGSGTQTCLPDRTLGACDCFDTGQVLAECQPGTRVVCECSPGVGGNHLCLPDASFEPCNCEGATPPEAGIPPDEDAG